MDEHLITSPANPRVKALVAMRRRRARDTAHRTVIEGRAELTLALQAGVEVLELYHCPDLSPEPAVHAALVRQVAAGPAQVWELSRAAFAKAAYREGPDGILAVVPAPGAPLPQTPPGQSPSPLLLVCEGVEKPGNLGAMVRTADAAGVDAVIAADGVGDWANPNVIRASKGAVFSVPVFSADTAQTVRWLDEHGITLVASTPEAAVPYTEVDLTGPVALAVGAEHHGLTSELLQAAAHRVVIPMAGQADSLNVATSAALLLFEAVRQRGR